MADLRELRAFVAVAEQLSFTRAAEVLDLSQQTVSETVRGLERELGVELLERTTRAVRMTDAGEVLLERGREAIRLADAAFETARAVGTGREGTLTIGVTPPVGPGDREEIVRALRARHPELSISIRELRPAELRGALHEHQVDIALNRASGSADESIDSAELRPSRMEAFVRAGHRLAGRDQVTLADFDGERLLTPSPLGTPYTDLLIARFAEAGATVTPVEAKVTGGSVMVTELDRVDAVVPMPFGSPVPPAVVALPVEGFTMPLRLLWPAGRPPVWVEDLVRPGALAA